MFYTHQTRQTKDVSDFIWELSGIMQRHGMHAIIKDGKVQFYKDNRLVLSSFEFGPIEGGSCDHPRPATLGNTRRTGK